MKIILTLWICFCSLRAFSQENQVFEGLKAVNGTSLFIKTIGTGEPVLFIHGEPGLSHDYFLPHMAPLSAQFNLIFYDQRGCGRSSIGLVADDMTMGQFMNDINALLIELGLDKVHLLGHSFGGLIAMKYATEHPDKVKSLILCNSVSASKEFDELSARKQQEAMTSQDNTVRSAIFASDHFKQGNPEAYEFLFKVGFKRSFYDTLAVEKLAMNLNSNFVKTSKLLYGLSPDLVSYDLHPALSTLQMPVLVIHGAADLVPAEVGNKLANTIPGAQYIIFEKSGHFPFIEQSSDFLKATAAFINSAPK